MSLSFSALGTTDEDTEDPQEAMRRAMAGVQGPPPSSTPPPTGAQPSFAALEQTAGKLPGGMTPGSGLSWGDLAKPPGQWDTPGMRVGQWGDAMQPVPPDDGWRMHGPVTGDPARGRGTMPPDEMPSYGRSAPAKAAGGDAQQTPPIMETFKTSLTQVQSATDPQQKAVARDKLARDVFGSLKDSGHDVKWNGDTIMVNGRAYTIAGGDSGAAGMSDPNFAKIDPALAGARGGGTGDTFGALGDALSQRGGAIQTLAGNAPQSTNLEAPGGGVQTLTGGSAPTADGAASGQMTQVDPNLRGTVEQAQQYLQQQFGAAFNGRQLDQNQLNEIARQVGFTGGEVTGEMMNRALGVAERLYGQPPEAPGTPGPPPAGSPNPAPSWAPEAQPYVPGDVPMDDLEGFSLDEILSRLGPSATDDAVDTSIRRLLDNPHSMDDLTVERMKAASKDELAEMSQMQDEEMRAMGARMGIDDSNWMASQRARAAFDRDRGIVQSNRAIDMEAAKTRKADERAALELGGGLANMSRQARQQAVALASDSALKAAAQTGDRIAMREGFRQKAAELGMEADQLTMQYTLGVMQDLTDRYGIDIGREIDMAKLEQAGSQFKEDLAFRMEQLRRQMEQFYVQENRLERQFGAGIGLSYAELMDRANARNTPAPGSGL